MLGFIYSMIIAILVLYVREKLVVKRIVVITFVFFLLIYLLAKMISYYPKDEMIMYREIVKYSLVLYLAFLVDFLFILIMNRILFFLGSANLKLNRILNFYGNIYLSVYILGNLLINYGIWLR